MTKEAQIGVIGSGAMGTGIAQVAAMAGHNVVLYDNNTAALEKAKTGLSATFQKLQEKGKIESAAELLSRFSFAATTQTFAGCSLIIEAIVEKLEVKKNVFGEVEQVVGGDAGPDKPIGVPHVVGGFECGDVLENDFELREIASQGDQLGVNKNRLAVKQIDVRGGHLAVHQEQQALALHGLQSGVNLAEVGDTRIAVGRGPRRVKFAGHHAGRFGALDFFGRQLVGEVQGHQRIERNASWHCCQDALTVSQRLRCRGDGGAQVGHDDGAAK